MNGDVFMFFSTFFVASMRCSSEIWNASFH